MLARTCLKEGTGTPLVFLHGFLGTANDWQAVADRLPFHCIGFDLPGHGKSPFRQSLTPDFCSALAAQKLPRLHLIGYSMGGRLALQFASSHPQRIASLTLISTHPGLDTEEEKQQRLLRDQTLAQEIRTLAIDEFLKRWYDQPLFKTLNAKMDIRRLRKNQNREGLAQALNAFSLGRQDKFPLPSLCLAGEHDPAYHRFANAIIPDAGHAAHLENPNAVAERIYEQISLDQVG